ncbi:MAG: hypothetical protein JKY55_18405 [Aliivibrio sp.]|uniref:hypothetical protein n=1 Tax=Aliivibrio sp. TaxID=1872443 RepID=UPI001A4A96EC|nr:hypothetical protein [Aliivibrio sp.]
MSHKHPFKLHYRYLHSAHRQGDTLHLYGALARVEYEVGFEALEHLTINLDKTMKQRWALNTKTPLILRLALHKYAKRQAAINRLNKGLA